MLEVGVDELAGIDDPAQAGVPDAAQFVGAPDELFELVFHPIVELQALAVEHLEAVVVGRVVGGRHHDPADEHPAAGEEGQRRRRHDPDRMDVDPEAGRAGRDGGDEHVPGPPGVLADDQRAAVGPEMARRGSTQVEGEGGLEIDVGDAADPIGPEQSWHRSASAGSRRRPGRGR